MLLRIAVTREIDPDMVSQLIMLETKAPFSHIMAIFLDENNVPTVFQATGKGVHTIALAEFMVDHMIVDEKIVELKKGREYFLGFVRGSHGKGYGHAQYLGFLAKFLRNFGDNDDKREICSELIATVLEDQCALDVRGDNDFVTPAQVFNAIP